MSSENAALVGVITNNLNTGLVTQIKANGKSYIITSNLDESIYAVLLVGDNTNKGGAITKLRLITLHWSSLATKNLLRHT